MSEKTWLICGGRSYDGPVHKMLDLIVKRAFLGDHPFPSRVIHGGARGVDHLASTWAGVNGFDAREYSADWEAHGRAAGPIRNQRMIDEGKPDLVIAFPGGRGTADMVRRARAAGVEVIEVDPDGTEGE